MIAYLMFHVSCSCIRKYFCPIIFIGHLYTQSNQLADIWHSPVT